jgi:hypothetical protein
MQRSGAGSPAAAGGSSPITGAPMQVGTCRHTAQPSVAGSGRTTASAGLLFVALLHAVASSVATTARRWSGQCLATTRQRVQRGRVAREHTPSRDGWCSGLFASGTRWSVTSPSRSGISRSWSASSGVPGAVTRHHPCQWFTQVNSTQRPQSIDAARSAWQIGGRRRQASDARRHGIRRRLLAVLVPVAVAAARH